MVRWFVVLVLAVALTVRASVAQAKMMEHFDLGGLVAQSEAVVIADRIGAGAPGGNGEPTTRYKIVKVLRGAIADTAVDVWDQIYRTNGHAIDARVVMFLARHHKQWFIVPSGLRVIERGGVFRFTQQRNPGPYEMVHQGHDPEDQWGKSDVQLDLAGLEQAIAAAGRRVDALAAAGKLTDVAKRRAAVLAVFAPPAIPGPGPGFYADVLARDARALLATQGDLEGALLVDARDRTEPWQRRDFAALLDLVAYAKEAKYPADLRALAIGAISRHGRYWNDAATVRMVIAQLDDPDPRVRAAACDAAARLANVSASDPAQRKLLAQLVAETRAAIARRFAIETDNRVLHAFAKAYEHQLRAPLPPRTALPLVAARARIDGAWLLVDVQCLRPKIRITKGKVIATHNGKSDDVKTFSVAWHCRDERAGGVQTKDPAVPLATGRYALAVELVVDQVTVQLPLGELESDAHAAMELVP